MKEEVKHFFESGKLEKYLMGLCTIEENSEVEYFIQKYPEVKKEYEALQRDIEAYAKSISRPAPVGAKAEIMNQINDLNSDPKSTASGSSSWIPKVAAVAAIALAAWFWNSDSNSQEKLNALQSKYDQLQLDCEERNQAMASLQAERALILHPATQALVLKGDAMGSEFFAAAFWNKEKSVGHINVENLPPPPDKHCFQLWADVDGKMVSLGVLPLASDQMVELPFKINATSLNVTIEPEGGSDHPTVSRLVASVAV